MYLEYGEYLSIYGDEMDELTFNRYEYKAARIADHMTTGADGICKMELYEADEPLGPVSHALADLIHEMRVVDEYKSSYGLSQASDGTYRGNIVKSINSGRESITFADAGGDAFKAATDVKYKEEYFRTILKDGLRGAKDRNGVNLLYAGPYPARRGNV